jgi:membrane protease YdiL (CAAX protease family)
VLVRFDRRDVRFVAACLVVAIGCGLVAWRWFGRAFPEASIEFAVNRSESQAVALAFLERLDLLPSGHRHAAVFDYDDDTKTFLERELGLERAQAVYGDSVRLWRWKHRWFRPHEREELRVDVTAQGEIAGFEHLIAEEAPGARLEAAAARTIAERFLVEQLHRALDDLDYLEGASTQQPNRLDHTFTWKRRGFEFAGATYRISVQVSGDHVTVYDEFLDIPQAWQDEYARLRASNETAAAVASMLLLLTGLAMVIVLVLRIRDHDVRWPTALAFGAVAFALQLLAAVNQFDIHQFTYETQDSYASFVTEFLLVALFGSLAYGSGILLLTAAAEPLYRERFPGKLALTSLFTRRGLRTKTFFREVLLGLTLMTFFAAYQTIFYIVAAGRGAWAPLEVPYNNMLNTAIPWALVLFIGFFPAVSEEFSSRMFSIPFLDRLLGRAGMRRGALVVAVLVSSFTWGFAHSNYPNQPFWIRGVEVGVAGIVVSLVMLRWGILATLVWHYTVDAFYTAFLLLRSGSTYFVVSGAITSCVMLVPLVVALGLYVRRGGFEPETGLFNADAPAPLPAPAGAAAAGPSPAAEAPGYRPVPRRRLLAAAAVAAALLLLFLVPTDEPGEGTAVESRRDQALAAARAHLAEMGADPARYRAALQMADRYQPEVGRYVLERLPLAALNEIYTDHLRSPVWRARFFRPDEKEEFIYNLPVDVPPQAAAGGVARPAIPVWAFEHVIADSAAGDSLTPDAAQLLAEDFLRARGLEPGTLELKDRRTERQKSRLDHTFEWQVPDTTLGEAGIRYLVVVRGSEVTGLRPYMHLPESWLRADEERSVLQRILWVLSRGIYGAVGIGFVVLFVVQVRARRFPWRRALGWGAAAAALSLGAVALQWHSELVARYETNVPWDQFQVLAVIAVVLQMVFWALVAAMLAGTMFALRPQTATLLSGGRDRAYGRDAVLLAIVGLLLQVGLDRLGGVVADRASRWAEIDHLLMLPAAAQPLPWLGLLLDSLRTALLALPCIALLLWIGDQVLGRSRSALFLAGSVVLFAAEGARSLPQFGLQLGLGALAAAVAAAAVVWLFRGNELAYLLVFLAGRGVATGGEWMQQPALRGVGVVFAVLMLAASGLAVWAALRPARRSTPAAWAASAWSLEPHSSAARSSTTEGKM